MATQWDSFPVSVAVLPFLFARPQPADPEWNFQAALMAAIAAEQADDRRRNSRGRIAYLICELGFQLARRRGDPEAFIPLSRRRLAEALEINLSRVKRCLGLLSLSGVLECDAESIRVSDWPRLCAIAAYEPRRLDLEEEDGSSDLPTANLKPESPPLLTMGGDPACFV